MNIFEVVKKINGRTQILDAIGSGKLISFLNPYSYGLIRCEERIKNGIDLWGMDGVMFQKIINLLFFMKTERVSFDFTSLADDVFKKCTEDSLTVYIVGADRISIQLFCEIISKRYPQMNLIGSRDGYFSSDDDMKLEIKKIRDLNPALLIVGMGANKQEKFMIACRDYGWSGTGISCGGFLHQTAKSGLQYYPHWIDKLNLRFAYRIYDEPKLIKRYLLNYPVNISYLLKDCIRRRA